MATVIHLYDDPDRFVAGTVGEPGERTFFLQARDGTRLTSVALEKQQVQILGDRLGELLDEVISAGGTGAVVPAMPVERALDNGPLDQPIEEEFRAGTITLSWDSDTERVIIEVFPVVEVEATPWETDEESLPELPLEEPDPDEVFAVHLTPTMAREFSRRAASVVSAGREQCPFCGGPIDPEGHLCPRANGYRRRA